MHEGHRERMRDRLFTDPDQISDHELLEILLYYCISRKNTNPVAHDLLDAFCDLQGVFSAPPALLSTVEGVGAGTSEFLTLVGALVSRIRLSDAGRRPRFVNFSDMKNFIGERFRGFPDEMLELYCVGEDGTLLYLRSVKNAHHSRVGIDARFISYVLAQIKPCGVIIAHTLPSGDMRPSAADDAAVYEIGKLCALHGAKFNDSVIYTRKGIYSYFCDGRLESALAGTAEENGGTV